MSSFLLNKRWTFRYGQRTTRRLGARFAIIMVVEAFYSNALLWLAGKVLQCVIADPLLWANLSKLVAVDFGTAISYVLMRFLIFVRPRWAPLFLPRTKVVRVENASHCVLEDVPELAASAIANVIL